MPAFRSTILAFTALILTGGSSAQSDFIDLGKVNLITVKIPTSTFAMGSDQVIHADDGWKPCPACAPRNDLEHPVHQVTISKDFWLGQFDVTQKQWQEVMATTHPSTGQPVPMLQLSRSVGRMSSPSWQKQTPCKPVGRSAYRQKRSGNTRPGLAALARPMGP